MEDSHAKTDPTNHKLVPELLPSYLEELAGVEARRADLDAQIKAPAVADDEDYDESEDDDADTLPPADLATLKKQLAAVKRQQKTMQLEFITKLGKARAELTAAQERDLVLRLTKNDVAVHLDAYVTTHRQQVIAALETWWGKYAVSLSRIEAEREVAAAKLAAFFKDLGYE